MSRILVTGGDGLLGSHLVRQLVARGDDVRILVQRGSTSPTLRGLPVERVEGDLLEGAGPLLERLDGCRYVFHCAAIADPWAPAELTWRVNLDGTRAVLDAALRVGVDRLVFVGSASSFRYGTQASPGDERAGYPTAYRGIPYMESKHAAMRLVEDYVRRRGLDALTVAPTFLLGDHDWRPSSGELVRRFLAGELAAVSTGGRSFAYAADVATGMVNALARGRRGERYILGGENLTYREFFAHVGEIAGKRPPRWVLPAPVVLAAGLAGSVLGRVLSRSAGFGLTLARLAVVGAYYSSRKAIRELDLPQTHVATGIEDTIRCLRDFGHI